MSKVNKRYYWLKLKNTHFQQLTQRKMRRQEHGLEMQIIYLKMMLASVDKGGYITYQGVFDTLEEELAVEFDEDPEMVRKTIAFLEKNNMITREPEHERYFIAEAYESIGSECKSAERVRQHRENKKKTLQCNACVTECNTDIEIDKRLDIRDREDIYIKIKDLFNSICKSYLPIKRITELRKAKIDNLLEVYTINAYFG